MIAWGWCAVANLDTVHRTLLAIAKRRGLEPTDRTADGPLAYLHAVRESRGDRIVVIGRHVAGPVIAAELSQMLGVAGRYAEVDLEDTTVAATAHEIAADGTRSPDEDLDSLVQELCAEWFEDRKHLGEAHHDLVAACLGLNGDSPEGGISRRGFSSVSPPRARSASPNLGYKATIASTGERFCSSLVQASSWTARRAPRPEVRGR